MGPGYFAFFLQEKLHAHAIPRFRGGFFWVWGGWGKCRFYFDGRGDFSENRCPQRTFATKVPPNFPVNVLVRFASKPLFWWVMTGSPLEFFRKFFGAVRALFWLWGSFLAPEILQLDERVSRTAGKLLVQIENELLASTEEGLSNIWGTEVSIQSADLPQTPNPKNWVRKNWVPLSGTGDSQREWFARIDSRESFAIETPIFIARQADSHESLEFPIIRANHPIRANRANRFARITPLRGSLRAQRLKKKLISLAKFQSRLKTSISLENVTLDLQKSLTYNRGLVSGSLEDFNPGWRSWTFSIFGPLGFGHTGITRRSLSGRATGPSNRRCTRTV